MEVLHSRILFVCAFFGSIGMSYERTEEDFTSQFSLEFSRLHHILQEAHQFLIFSESKMTDKSLTGSKLFIQQENASQNEAVTPKSVVSLDPNGSDTQSQSQTEESKSFTPPQSEQAGAINAFNDQVEVFRKPLSQLQSALSGIGSFTGFGNKSASPYLVASKSPVSAQKKETLQAIARGSGSLISSNTPSIGNLSQQIIPDDLSEEARNFEGLELDDKKDPERKQAEESKMEEFKQTLKNLSEDLLGPPQMSPEKQYERFKGLFNQYDKSLQKLKHNITPELESRALNIWADEKRGERDEDTRKRAYEKWVYDTLRAPLKTQSERPELGRERH